MKRNIFQRNIALAIALPLFAISFQSCEKEKVEPTYNLNLSISPELSGTVSGAGEYEVAEIINISATPEEGYEFENWTGDIEHIEDINSSNTNVLMPAKEVNIIANFRIIDTETPKTIANFSEIELATESYWNGSDESGGFTSGNVFFPNYFTDWGGGMTSWSGFSVSNITDNTTPGFENEFSSITGSGYNNNSNYAVAYISDPNTYENIMFIELVGLAAGKMVDGIYITNSTWAALAMQDGDGYADAFEQGDYFKVTFTGFNNDTETSSVTFFLADFRSNNAGEHYIVNTWEWVNLKSLGNITKVKITLESTDIGEYGMKTPAYFCIGQVITFDE